MAEISFDLKGTEETVKLQTEAPEMFNEIAEILKTHLPKVGIELSDKAAEGAALLAVHGICNRYVGKDPDTVMSIEVERC